MHTSEQYFAELAACLSWLPEAEREEILTYHREYAAEAGMDSYEQLAAHFGAPHELADLLRQQLDTRRPEEEDGAASAAAGLGDAVRNLLGALFGAADSGQDAGGTDWTQQALPPFENVQIRTVAADIRFEEGEAFAVRYCLPARERLERLEVADGTLYFATRAGQGVFHRTSSRVEIHFGGDSFHFSREGGAAVVVIVPRDAVLKRLCMATVSGDIRLEDRTCVDLPLRTTSGDVELRKVDCTAAELVTTSGDVELTTFGCDSFSVTTTSGDVECQDLAGNCGEIHTVSGDVECEVELDTLGISTVSGDCRVSGPVRLATSCTTVSGDVCIHAPDAAVNASSTSGSVRCNGMKARVMQRDGAGCKLTLRSTSGDIDIAL